MSALDVGITMACSCATVQALLGVDGEADPASAAKALTIADDGGSFDWLDDDNPGQVSAANGDDITLQPPLMVIGDAGETGGILDAPHALSYSGTVSIVLVIAAPAAASYAGSTITRWIRTQQLAIRDELVAQIGGTGAFSSAGVNTVRPYRSDTRGGSLQNAWFFQLDITWE